MTTPLVTAAGTELSTSPKVTPFLWFDDNAEEAMRFYASVFPNSEILGITRYGETGPGPKGTVMTVTARLGDLEFTGLNGGPHFAFSEATSFVIHCETQTEVDYYWDQLAAGGKTSQCGWLKDRYGLSWQIVPTMVLTRLQEGDAGDVQRMMRAIMGMTKLDVAALERAYQDASAP